MSESSISWEIKSILGTFKLPELRELLQFAGMSKSGNKRELVDRCVEILEHNKIPFLEERVVTIYMQRNQASVKRQPPLAKGELTLSSSMAVESPAPEAAVGARTPSPAEQTRSPDSTSGVEKRKGLELEDDDDVSVITVLTPKRAKLEGGSSSFTFASTVRMKPLPFYEVLKTLVGPKKLAPASKANSPERTLTISLNLSQMDADKISMSRQFQQDDNKILIQYSTCVFLRFCTLPVPFSETEREDECPPGLEIKVNGQKIPLPKKYPNIISNELARDRAIDLTKAIKSFDDKRNEIEIRWLHQFNDKTGHDPEIYYMTAYLSRRISVEEMLMELLKREKLPLDKAKENVNTIVSEDEEIHGPTPTVSLQCPVTRKRIQMPCRGVRCKHIQCFDAESFLQMNDKTKRPKFKCPVCNDHLQFKELLIDSFFESILQGVSDDVNDVVVMKDGNFAFDEGSKSSTVMNEIDVF